eukprot:8381271-Lingulodinium_polyedra.AAC.1
MFVTHGDEGYADAVECLLSGKEITERTHPELTAEIAEAKLAEWQTVNEEKRALRVLTAAASRAVRQAPNPR